MGQNARQFSNEPFEGRDGRDRGDRQSRPLFFLLPRQHKQMSTPCRRTATPKAYRHMKLTISAPACSPSKRACVTQQHFLSSMPKYRAWQEYIPTNTKDDRIANEQPARRGLFMLLQQIGTRELVTTATGARACAACSAARRPCQRARFRITNVKYPSAGRRRPVQPFCQAPAADADSNHRHLNRRRFTLVRSRTSEARAIVFLSAP